MVPYSVAQSSGEQYKKECTYYSSYATTHETTLIPNRLSGEYSVGQMCFGAARSQEKVWNGRHDLRCVVLSLWLVSPHVRAILGRMT